MTLNDQEIEDELLLVWKIKIYLPVSGRLPN